MSLIVSLFLGLTISAEEIFRDRKILKREHFLNLSRTSYLLSKVSILIMISAIQTLLFIIIANPILGIKGMYLQYWLALFTTAFCANMLGLNISASFNSAITIYIVIPLLIIPMMVLSGAMFPFDKLNRSIGSIEKVPLIAEIMPTRWTYEGLIVTQFKDNKYSRVKYDKKEGETFYQIKKSISEAEFNKTFRLKVLREALETTLFEYKSNPINSVRNEDIYIKKPVSRFSKLQLIKNELEHLAATAGIPRFTYLDDLTPYEFNISIADSLTNYLDRINKTFTRISNSETDKKDRFFNENDILLKKMGNDYFNSKLEEIVTKYYERNKYLIYNNTIVQNIDPIYLDPANKGILAFRTHFYAPSKYFLGIKTDTFVFNISIVLISTIFLYFILYYELLGKAVRFVENLKFRK